MEALREGVRPSEIWKKYPVSERSVKYVLRKLKAVGLIRKIGYGTWELLPGAGDGPRRCKVIHRVTLPHTPKKVQKKVQNLKADTVRGHGIVATIKLARERFLNWDQRHVILMAKEIPYKPIPQGQRIQVGDLKVWLTPRSIVLYFPRGASWYGETAKEVAGAIMEDVIAYAGRIERLIGIDTLKIRGNYHVKFSRNHYALIKNGLAHYYNSPRRKLEVRDDGGLWLLIDNSFNLEELETVHPETAQDDNRKVQDFFNSLKKYPLTTDFVIERFAETASQIKEAHGHLAMYAQNLETHVSAVNSLSLQAKENAKTTISLREALERLTMAMIKPREPGMRPAVHPIRPSKKQDKLPSTPIALLPERKQCALCRNIRDIPRGKYNCEECEKLLDGFRGERTTSSLASFLS